MFTQILSLKVYCRAGKVFKKAAFAAFTHNALVHSNVKCAVTYARKLGLYVGRGDEVFFP